MGKGWIHETKNIYYFGNFIEIFRELYKNSRIHILGK